MPDQSSGESAQNAYGGLAQRNPPFFDSEMAGYIRARLEEAGEV
jgi:hypothetical protein